MMAKVSGYKVKLDKRVLERMIQEVPERADAAMSKLAHLCDGFAKESLGTGPPGIVYYFNKPGYPKSHQASGEPGPPAILTGNLKNSIVTVKISPFTYAVLTGTPYARALEFGYAPRNLGARPYMLPAAEKAISYAPDELKAVVEKIK